MSFIICPGRRGIVAGLRLPGHVYIADAVQGDGMPVVNIISPNKGGGHQRGEIGIEF